MKGPRALDVNGLPLHRDNQTIVRERIFLDPANHDRLHDEITVIDHAYTRPWTVMRDYAGNQSDVGREQLHRGESLCCRRQRNLFHQR